MECQPFGAAVGNAVFPSPESSVFHRFQDGRWNAIAPRRLLRGRGAGRSEATMKPVLLALWLAASVHGVAVANESRHAATVDMPEVITLTHATPDTWYTLPPVQQVPEVTRQLIHAACHSAPPLVFAQVGRL